MSKAARPGATLAILTILVVIAAVVASIALNPPGDVRKHRIDSLRIQDLNTIQRQINSYWALHHMLPPDLSTFADKGGPSSRDRDPENGQLYGYEIIDKTSYKLCATFSAATEAGSEQENDLCCSAAGTSRHPVGHYCFDYTVKQSPPGIP